jgi:hypothetical protein
MPRQARITGSDNTVLQVPWETMFSDSAERLPERSTVCKSAKTAAAVGPTESEIATLAFQLWLDNGCPDGTDREDWIRAEAMLKTAFAAAYERLSRGAPIPCWDAGSEYEFLADFRWEGHWEVWEREWGGIHWVCDLRPTST